MEDKSKEFIDHVDGTLEKWEYFLEDNINAVENMEKAIRNTQLSLQAMKASMTAVKESIQTARDISKSTKRSIEHWSQFPVTGTEDFMKTYVKSMGNIMEFTERNTSGFVKFLENLHDVNGEKDESEK